MAVRRERREMSALSETIGTSMFVSSGPVTVSCLRERPCLCAVRCVCVCRVVSVGVCEGRTEAGDQDFRKFLRPRRPAGPAGPCTMLHGWKKVRRALSTSTHVPRGPEHTSDR